MTKFLVDSDIVIWFLKGREKETSLLQDLSSRGDLFISVVTITEVRAGLKKNARKIISDLKEVFRPIPLNDEMAELAGEFKQKYNLGIADMFIAATAVASGSTLATYNKKHFPMPHLRILEA